MARRIVYVGLCLCGMVGFQAVVRELLANGAPGFVFGFGCGFVSALAALVLYRRFIGPID